MIHLTRSHRILLSLKAAILAHLLAHLTDIFFIRSIAKPILASAHPLFDTWNCHVRSLKTWLVFDNFSMFFFMFLRSAFGFIKDLSLLFILQRPLLILRILKLTIFRTHSVSKHARRFYWSDSFIMIVCAQFFDSAASLW